MKRTKLFGLMMALVVGMGFTACTEDDDAAMINIVIEGEVAKTVAVGADVNITYNVVSDEKLDLIEHLVNNKIVASVEDFTSSNSFSGSFDIPTTTAQTVLATIRVTDRKGKVETREFTIEVESSVETYTAVLLGSQASSSEGSFYATSTNEVFTVATAAENADLVDFIYFYGLNNKAAIAAPADGDVQSVFDGIADWSVKNETIFGLQSEMTATEFEAITESDEAILAATANTDLFLNRVALLSEGDIVAFVTEAGKKGIFMVSSIEGNTYGEESKITLEVKVQK